MADPPLPPQENYFICQAGEAILLSQIFTSLGGRDGLGKR